MTMTQLAVRAGVTQATVSLALSGHPRISSETRDRIQALARKFGYKPHPYITSLMRSRRQGRPLRGQPVLALVCAFNEADRWRNHPAATIRAMREGAVARAAELGYQAQEFWLHREGMSAERFSSVLRARGIQGLLVSPLPDGTSPPPLRWESFSAVSLNAPHRTLTITTVSNDHYFSSFRAVEECARRGYRRPGLAILQSHHARFHGRWEAGFAMACSTRADLRPVAPLFLADWADVAAIRTWLRRERPDVIIGPGGQPMAELLQREGRDVPRKIGVASLACPAPGDATSGIFQNGHLIGACAVEILIGMLERHECGLPEQAKALMVQGAWNEGHTLRPVVNE
jgi:DNA-binding LacI/PurR family transcriptional regulator